MPSERIGNQMIVANKPDGPKTHKRFRMIEASFGRFLIQAAAKVQGPERFEHRLAVRLFQAVLQFADRRSIGAISQEPYAGLPNRTIVARKQFNQFMRGFLGKIDGRDRLAAFGTQAVNAAVGSIDLTLIILPMVDLTIIPIGDIQVAVGAELDIHGSKPRVVRSDREAEVASAKGRAFGENVAEDDMSQERLDAEKLAAITIGQPKASSKTNVCENRGET